ncbi:hypothetical protein [Streptomyces specialis]|uniref:hypothetical protein n=1 Tax=Streptomyces specialis TaxID=498367 RepID=UPI000B2CD636|nr:hypothetical protein [Streptomyces specialis]
MDDLGRDAPAEPERTDDGDPAEALPRQVAAAVAAVRAQLAMIHGLPAGRPGP